MPSDPSLYWYDSKTFGINHKYQCIAQFSGVRTNFELEIIDEPLVLHCKPSLDFLPDPYEREWRNGNSHWDIVDLVRATPGLRPDGIVWPDDVISTRTFPSCGSVIRFRYVIVFLHASTYLCRVGFEIPSI